MTDDELLVEVTNMRADGSRGESEELEGTPSGSYLAAFKHPLPVFNDARMSFGFTPALRIIRDAFMQLSPTEWSSVTTSTGSAGLENAAHPA